MSGVGPGVLPAELVPGEPDEVERLAARLIRFAAGAGEVSERLDRLRSGVWSGEAGGLFREAVGEVPASLTRAATAFATAARALSTYAGVLRDSQAAAARAVRLVEQSTPESREADQQTASRLVARARTEVAEAGRIAAARLSQAAADAPDGGRTAVGGAVTAGLAVRVVTDYELTDPDGFVAPSGDWGGSAADLRFTEPHDVCFAESGAAPAGAAAQPEPVGSGSIAWESWAAADTGRHLGVVEPGMLAALGPTVLGRRRRPETALAQVGLDEAELRRRREEFGGARHRDGVPAPARAGRLGSADAWRTRVASAPRAGGTVPPRTRPDADPLPRARPTGERTGSVDSDLRGAAPRTGRPAHEGG